MLRRTFVIVGLVLTTCVGTGMLAWSATSGLGRLVRQVVASGGATTESGNRRLDSTIGQNGVGTTASGSRRMALGFWTQRASQATAVGDLPNPTRVTRLESNQPNPFNPTTTIHYSLAERGPMRLVLHDARGRRVRVVLDEVREAGRHEFVLDATGLSSGVYWVRMEAGAYRSARRMVLVK